MPKMKSAAVVPTPRPLVHRIWTRGLRRATWTMIVGCLPMLSSEQEINCCLGMMLRKRRKKKQKGKEMRSGHRFLSSVMGAKQIGLKGHFV